jgi:hypothetical protein
MSTDPAVAAAGISATVIIPRSRVTRPDDPSQYIRTYAKDVAQITGKNPIPPSRIKPPQKAVTPSQDLFTPEDTSLREGMAVSNDAPKPEVFATSKKDEEGIFATAPDPFIPMPPVVAAPIPVPIPEPLFAKVPAAASMPAPLVSPTPSLIAPVLQEFPVPLPVFATPPLETAGVTAAKEAAYKEGILARLRASAKAQSAPIAPSTKDTETHREINLLKSQATLTNDTYKPSPKIPLYSPLSQPQPFIKATSITPPTHAVTPAPAVASNPTPVPVVTPVSTYVPKPVSVPIPVPPIEPTRPSPPLYAPVSESSSPLHTYSTDFADHIDEQRATTFSVLAAQQDSAAPTALPRKATSSGAVVKIFAAVGILILGIGLAGGAVYLYTRNTESPFVSAQPPSLIPFDESVELKGAGTELQTNIAVKSKELLLLNNVLLTYVTESSSTAQGTRAIPLPGGFLIARLQLNIPDILLRNIDPSSTAGIIHAGNQTAPFFILSVNSYERTFAGMLAWESTMMADLGILYPSYPTTVTTAPITTPSSPSLKVVAPAAGAGFVDKVVSNRNVRQYIDTQGNSLVLYGYVDKQTLVIARDADAFTALLSRLSSRAGR